MATGYSRAAIDIAPGGTNGIASDGHAFDHTVRVAFQHTAVHECTPDLLHTALQTTLLEAPSARRVNFHFRPVGNPPAAASAQTGLDKPFPRRFPV